MEFIDDLKIIWRFLSKYKKQFYIIFVVAILASIIEATIPYIYGKIIDFIIAGKAMSVIIEILFLWLVLSFIRDWGKRYIIREGGIIGVKCANNLVLYLNEHVLKLDIKFHKNQKTGKLASKYIRASDYLDAIISSVIFQFVPNLLTIFFIYFIVLYINLGLSFILGLIIIVYMAVTFNNIGIISKLFVRVIKSYENAQGFVYDSVANIQTVKASGNEYIENKKIKEAFNKNEDFYIKFSYAWSKLDLYQQTIVSVGIVLLFSFIIVLYRNNSLSIGEIVMLVGYISLIFVPLGMMSDYLDQYKRSMSIIKRALSLLDEEIEPYDKKGTVKLKDIKGKIEFQKINFCYHETRQILKDISFKINSGEVVALVGESGVGKSTMMDLISRYNIPTSGKIFLDGIDIQKINLRSLRQNIAIVPQEVSLFNDSLKNNIVYGKLDATDDEINQAIKAANADEFINNFPDKINQEVGERGVKLSIGQKQRVAIARAILKNPKILILDEATSALDSKSEMLVQQALKKLIRGRTTFIIAHRLSTIMHVDKILVIDKGEIIEEGNHEELIKNKKLYYELFSLQLLEKNDS